MITRLSTEQLRELLETQGHDLRKIRLPETKPERRYQRVTPEQIAALASPKAQARRKKRVSGYQKFLLTGAAIAYGLIALTYVANHWMLIKVYWQ